MKEIRWISHRGYHAQHVENTQAAFEAAVQAGFSCLETDLRATVDGHIVLHHDANMRRTANRGVQIEDLTLAEFKSIKLIDGQYGMAFEEFIEQFAGMNWIFDLKPESAATTIELLQSWCQKKRAMEWVQAQARFLAWSKEDESLLRRCFPGAVTLAMEKECQRAGLSCLLHVPWIGAIKRGRTYALPPKFAGRRLYTRRMVEAYQRRGARVLAYLPETRKDAQDAIRAGVDEVLTNDLPVDVNE